MGKKFDKKYYAKKNKSNYEKDKKIKTEYQLSANPGESYTQFKNRMKKYI